MNRIPQTLTHWQARTACFSFNTQVSKVIEDASCLYPLVVPLTQADTGKAAVSSFNAFVEDPLTKYLNADEKPSPRLVKLVNKICLMQWRKTKVVLTVDAGAAVVVATSPQPTGAPIDRLTEFLLSWLISILRQFRSREGRKRTKEATEKIKQVISETLGNRIDKMFHVNLLATDPQSQGRGYGGALLEAVVALADLAGQAIWLESSNIDNTDFYMSHGFTTVGQACLGDTNPHWHGKPVVIPVMVREPKKGFFSGEKK